MWSHQSDAFKYLSPKTKTFLLLYLPMKALDRDCGRAREMNLDVVGLALIDKNRTICAELTKPYNAGHICLVATNSSLTR